MRNPSATRRALFAYAGPFALFILLLPLAGWVKNPGAASMWLRAPEFWLYPLQTVICAAVLLHFRHEYPRTMTRRAALAGAGVGVLAFVLWVAPQILFHAPPRIEGGFDPSLLSAHPVAYWWSLCMRFARLVIVVPLVEEIFWRGFLLRYLVKEDFLAIPFGTCTALSFWAVVAGFTFEHSRADWPAACATGILYNVVAVRTKSLPACVLAHALTNALLGLHIMRTHQWGFW